MPGAEPEQAGDQERHQVGEWVPEALDEGTRAGLLGRLAPEERRHDDALLVADTQSLQDVQTGRDRAEPEQEPER